MSHRFSLAVVFLFLSAVALADEREVLFEGFDLKLERITDAMTDAKTCALFVESGPIYFSVEGRSKVTIWPNSDEIHFSPDDKHLVRIGSGVPVELSYVAKRNALAAMNDEAIVKALASRQPIKIRYYDWPSHDTQDVAVEAPAFAYVWGMAEKQCGWPSLGVPAELPEAKLSVYESKDHDGYASVSVTGNQKLGLSKGFDKYGGGCQISLGVNETVGMQGGRWTSGKVDMGGRTKLIVRDQAGAVIFEAKVPTEYDLHGSTRGNIWDRGQDAAQAMWKAAPFGTVSITGSAYAEENVPLYGFCELWSWGIQRCSFPAVE